MKSFDHTPAESEPRAGAGIRITADGPGVLDVLLRWGMFVLALTMLLLVLLSPWTSSYWGIADEHELLTNVVLAVVGGIVGFGFGTTSRSVFGEGRRAQVAAELQARANRASARARAAAGLPSGT